ncbi:LysR family transcriptional regulator [Allobranchiibius huperziae]|uniref:DNA-binding transcriptional LysR family regulator n=1 Tax=Allobranchiibius huperziae TaxID=1874116 RepID=A0A853D8Z8_9MICO|nr:DNA-binding transcriptional LysR family regulator [Allobranchiibius huperziae]
MELNLTEVLSWTVLAREGHYGRAADELHVSTSCLTKRIQRLESQLGTVLVERGPGGVLAITGTGRLFAVRAERLLDDARRLATSAHEPAAPVVVGVPGFDGARVFEHWARNQPPTVRETLATFVCWVGIAFDHLDLALKSQRVDIMLTAGASTQPGIRSTRLWPLDRIGLVARSHPLSGRRTVPVEQFATLPFLRSAAAPPDWMSLWCLGDVRPMSEARMVEVAPRSMSDVLGSVARGSVVAVSPTLVGPVLPPPVSYVRLEGAPPAWYFAHTRHDEPRRVVTEVLRLLASIPAEQTFA